MKKKMLMRPRPMQEDVDAVAAVPTEASMGGRAIGGMH